MKSPERNEVIEKVAANMIDRLDADFERDEVQFIAEWIHYLSTQD